MKCVINAIAGNETPRQKQYVKNQAELRKAFKRHFKGKLLTWRGFPNDSYDTTDFYNVKASAFEEAIKEGCTQILWVDAPVVALKDVTPLFDLIEKDGYLMIKNNKWNCAETVSDKCLKYFDVTRDEAEKIQEHASGVIGVDIENANGSQLLWHFLTASGDGAGNGSRGHDNQSADPRFQFHRQDQSVLSLSAHKVGLPYNMVWDTGPICLNPTKVHANTLIAWSERSGNQLRKTRKRRK
jgi:hypothetical protein